MVKMKMMVMVMIMTVTDEKIMMVTLLIMS